jgi:8-oxo-dGTP pyrophosphatase MutT (NUDIX family)
LPSDKRKPKAFLACYLVLIRNGKILLSKRANTGYQDGKYSMVAGHFEGGETVWEALIREVKEESGISLDPKGLKVVHIMHRLDIDREYVDFYVLSDTTEEPRNLEPEKCDGLAWFNRGKLPSNTIPYVRQAVESINREEFYSEFKSYS